MLAIPSPDVLLSLFASAGQALGLVAIVFGRLFWGRARMADAGTESRARGTSASTWVLAGLLLLTGGAFLMYHLRAVDLRNQRLAVNLHRTSVEGGKAVGGVSLKTLSMSEQVEHTRGVSTARVAEWLATGEPLNLVDVREPEEVEMGHIAGSWHCRYPDLKEDPSGLRVPGARTVLICYSGNRSSELAEEFHEQGIDTSFVVGGYEMWLAEGRPLVNGVDRDELRALPWFPNRDRLLDTAEVMALVEGENALFVDVRYPEDLERHALPGVENLPIRRMPTDEMNAALADLPQRPIVVPCYDRRSSFYGQILGLRLHRMGRDFRGLYTVPHEYWRPTGERAHVAAWRASRSSRTLLDLAREPLADALVWIRARLPDGSLALGIVLLVLGLRVLLLPLTLKADRDQVVQQRLKPRLEGLRAKFRDDRPRALRAVLQAQKDARLTPLRNFVGSLVVLVLFIVMFTVVDRAAVDSAERFLWVPALGEPDPSGILPILVGLLTAALVLNNGRRTRIRWSVAIVTGFGLGLLTVWLRAAVGLYLTVNLGLIVLQGRLLRRYLARGDRQTGKESSGTRPARRRVRGPVVPLRKVAGLPEAGGKARRLAEMLEAGLPVPDGFVILDAGRRLPPDADLLSAFDRLGAEQVAVRSSGVNEDGADHSYAGVFDTELEVRREELTVAVARIRESLHSVRAAAYSNGADEQGSILVQAMVPARYAGVAFGEDPACSGTLVVEMVEGLGESLVSGRATPSTFRFGRHSLRPVDDAEPPVPLQPLLELVREAERRFGSPQDVEWAFADGRYWLLQARDITASSRSGDGETAVVENERHRLLQAFGDRDPDEVVLEQDELAELLPEPTPFSAGLMDRLWAAGGAVDLACRRLGIPYDVREDAPPYVVTAFGRTYTNAIEAMRRRGKGLGALAAFRLARSGESLEREFRAFIERHHREARLREGLDLCRFDRAELLQLLRESLDRFCTSTYVQAEVVNVAAEFHLRTARERLEKRGLDPARYLGSLPQTVVNQAYGVLADESIPMEEAVDRFLATFGHRATHDFELSEPRYREERSAVRERASMLRDLSRGEAEGRTREAPDQAMGRILDLCLDRARRFQTLKEEAKHHCLRDLAFVRDLLRAIGLRVGLQDGVFHLTPEEVFELTDSESVERFRKTAARRYTAANTLRNVQSQGSLTVADLEILGRGDLRHATSVEDGSLAGARVAGVGDVVGRARVLREVGDLDTFEPGEVLVTHCTDPDWTPLFAQARGIVTEVGGWLSHAAIQAREYRLPAVVGARGAMKSIRTGDLVCLHADGRISVFEDRRSEPRFTIRSEARITWQGGEASGQVRDLSKSGARVQFTDDPPPLGTFCTLRVEGDKLRAEGVSNGFPKQLGFRFAQPLATERIGRLVRETHIC